MERSAGRSTEGLLPAPELRANAASGDDEYLIQWLEFEQESGAPARTGELSRRSGAALDREGELREHGARLRTDNMGAGQAIGDRVRADFDEGFDVVAGARIGAERELPAL
jgi:hypothetical protein